VRISILMSMVLALVVMQKNDFLITENRAEYLARQQDMKNPHIEKIEFKHEPIDFIDLEGQTVWVEKAHGHYYISDPEVYRTLQK